MKMSPLPKSNMTICRQSSWENPVSNPNIYIPQFSAGYVILLLVLSLVGFFVIRFVTQEQNDQPHDLDR